MKMLFWSMAIGLVALSGFSAEKISTVKWDGQEIKDVRDVRLTSDGRVSIMYASGGFTTTEDKLPTEFLASWGLTKEVLEKAQSTKKKKTETDFNNAVRMGLFREVDGIVYDLRKNQPGWAQFRNVQVIQVLDDGVIVMDMYGLNAMFIRNLNKTVGDTDTISFTAKLTGTYSYINKLKNDRTIRAYDVGLPCGLDDIPEAITKENKLSAKAPGSKATKKVLAQLPESGELNASGTGFFITEDGFLITNFHVVENATKVKVKTKAGVLSAEVVKKDQLNDLALLKIAGKFKSLPISETNSVALGESVFTIGFPNVVIQGLQAKYTDGKISSLSGMRDDPDNYQISVPVQPGNSGGPLMDMNGKVVGVIVARISDIAVMHLSGTVPQNVNYAIKVKILREFLSGIPDVIIPPAKKSPKPEEIIKSTEEGVAMLLVY